MTLLAIDFATVAVKAGQFILSFSILVVLHELGHFIPAKLFKCRVEKFYLFFNPGFSLFKIKKGETEYGIGWVPFGGFVKISGMIDESMDKEQMKLPPEDHEFRSKPAWQRLIIMTGGVLVNVLLAIVIFIGITAYWGEESLPMKNLKYGISTDSLAQSIGIKDGDNIVAIDNRPLEYFGTVAADIVLKDAKSIQLERGAEKININIPPSLSKQLVKNKNMDAFVGVRYPAVVDSVLKTAVITKGKLVKGDTLIALNNIGITFYHQLVALRSKFKDSIVELKILRGKDTVTTRCLLKDGLIGFIPENPGKMFGTVVKKYSLAEAVPIGIKRCKETLQHYITGLKRIFTGKDNPNDSLGSVISIGNTFPGVWDWERFWTLTGIFSIILAFMNILPIPALDGGHALFTLVEMITGRKPGDKFMEYAQIAGMVLLLSLMVYALGLDFWRLFK
ncbi:RIP metalloprotease RseP [Parasediminibacterium sp. JCM 36343]|uniref:RIP metalloprotease RseP n=1 Tax=Parasediminibacterium sp. JCM 36343 TaxID=3374279 RepID=UPI00397BA169